MTPSDASYHRPLHTVALILTVATFPLIFLGGLVTTYGAGMSVPDWPNSYGYNMFLFPVSQWVGGIFYEHTHRLKGTLVGFLAVMLVFQAYGPSRNSRTRQVLGYSAASALLIAIVWGGGVWILESAGRVSHEAAKSLQHGFAGSASLGLLFLAAWVARRRESRRWLRRLTVVALVAVSVQGLLGGLRVTEVNLTLAIIHGCFAQAFFCLTAFITVASSRWWVESPNNYAADEQKHQPTEAGGVGVNARRIGRLSAVCWVIVFVQLIIGATMRHHGAGLAIPDLPLAYGKLLPPTDAAGLATVNQHRAWVLHEPPVTLNQVWLHFGHRIGAIVVSIALIGLLVVGWRLTRDRKLRWPLMFVGGLLVIQFSLGALTVYYRKPAEVASAHVAFGALLLLTLAVLSARAMRLAAVTSRARSGHALQAAHAPPLRKVAANA